MPPPTHAFIGGSSGNLREIIGLLLKKSPGGYCYYSCDPGVHIRVDIHRKGVIFCEYGL